MHRLVKHRESSKFWRLYRELNADVQRLADANYELELLKSDSRHPSLQLKKVEKFWFVRIGLHYRAVAVEECGPGLVLDRPSC